MDAAAAARESSSGGSGAGPWEEAFSRRASWWPGPSPSSWPGAVGSPPAPYSAGATAGLCAVVCSLIVFTVSGNVLVVAAVRRSRALRRAPQHLFVVSLACADVLVAALVMPFSLANEVVGAWAFGPAWCRAYLALDVLFCTASIGHLCAISLDRYWAVTRALQYGQRRTARRVRGAIAGVWLLSGAISVPPLLSSYGAGEQPPRCRLNDQPWYILSSCAASFFAPCLIMLLVYARIYRVAKRRTLRTLSRKQHDAGGDPPEHPKISAQPDHAEQELEPSSPLRQQRGERRGRRRGSGGRAPSLSAFAFSFSSSSRRASSACGGSQAREKRFTFVLAVVMGVFVVCWFPFFFSYSLSGICRQACQVPETLFKFFFWIGYCNSALNPVIYTVFNQDFRRSFKHILFGKRKRRRRKSPTDTTKKMLFWH